MAVHNVRCNCSFACRVARAEYSRAIRSPDWKPWRYTEEVRAHLQLLLDAGMTKSEIARQAGTTRKGIYAALKQGRKPQPSTAKAILAVKPEPTFDPRRVDGIGTHRRLVALIAAGWSQSSMASRLGSTPANLRRYIDRDHQNVSITVALRVAELYKQLINEEPTLFQSLVVTKRAKNLAYRKGFAPPMCWDEDTIDDPEAIPEWTGACGTTEGFRIHKRDGISVAGRVACEPCQQAVNRYEKRRKHAKG